MARGNILCETYECGLAAKYFGMSENTKIRCCEGHWQTLSDKGMEIHGIDGYFFISNPQDVATFAERNNTVNRGRGNLRVLINSCDKELMEALQDIEIVKNNVMKSVESRFEEMKVALAGICSEMKRQLSLLEADFEQFLISKENQLSPTSLLCLNVGVIPKFMRFGIADPSDYISAALYGSWAIANADAHGTLRYFDANQRKTVMESALSEALDRAQKGISDAAAYADSLFAGMAFFNLEKWKVISEVLKASKEKNAENEKWLERCWSLREQYVLSDQSTVEIGKKFAVHICNQFGRFADANRILRYCHDIASRQNFEPEITMSVCNELCGVYFSSEQYEYVESLGMWTLGKFAGSNLPDEHYWTTLLYITSSMRQLSKYDEAKAIIENWKHLGKQQKSKLAEMLRHLTYGIGVLPFNSGKAEKRLHQARCIGLSYFPASPFTALALFQLGLIRITDARFEYYLNLAKSIYEAVSPKCAQAAINLSKLGDVNRDIGRLSNAEQYYCQARTIYTEVNLNSLSAAMNFIRLGDFYNLEKRWNDIEDCCKQAHSILNDLNSMSSGAANCWLELGHLWKTIECWDKVEECYRQIVSIVERASAQQRIQLENVIGKLEDLRTRLAVFPFDAPRQGNTQASIKLLGISKEGVLRVFDIQSTAWEPPLIHQKVHIDEWTTYAFVSTSEAVLCSSTQHIDRRYDGVEVYKLKFREMQVSELPRFPARRIFPGLFFHEGNLFAFAGDNIRARERKSHTASKCKSNCSCNR